MNNKLIYRIRITQAKYMSIIIQYYSKTINYAKKQFHKTTTNRNTYPTFF